MTRQDFSQAEGHAAHSAGEGPFAGVGAPVVPQLAVLPKRLATLLTAELATPVVLARVLVEVGHCGKLFATFVTPVRLFARVEPLVNVEIVCVFERFATFLATEWLVVGVDSPVVDEVRLLSECLIAGFTLKRLVSGVQPPVVGEGGLQCEPSAAHVAYLLLLTGVGQRMGLDAGQVLELFFTDGAAVGKAARHPMPQWRPLLLRL